MPPKYFFKQFFLPVFFIILICRSNKETVAFQKRSYFVNNLWNWPFFQSSRLACNRELQNHAYNAKSGSASFKMYSHRNNIVTNCLWFSFCSAYARTFSAAHSPSWRFLCSFFTAETHLREDSIYIMIALNFILK